MMTSIYFYCEFDNWLNTEQICMGANMICDPKQILETKRLRRRNLKQNSLVDTEGLVNRLG